MKSIKSLLQDTLLDMLPVVPTMDVVVFPHQIVPLLVLDERIIRGINKALEKIQNLYYCLHPKNNQTLIKELLEQKIFLM